MWRDLRAKRRHLFERFGSERYSRPQQDGFEDRIGKYLPNGPGVFFEAGAFDGYYFSNTYYLERFKGWRGVLVEAMPPPAERCRKERPNSKVFNCALVAEGGPEKVEMRYQGPMSTRDAEAWVDINFEHSGWERCYDVTVPGRTLTSVLDEADVGEIDLFTLDVEGFEVDVLNGLDLERHRPKVMLVETNGRADEIRGILEPSGYSVVEEVGINDLLFKRVD
jgi:FkbM family methyltransferase